MIKYMMKKVIKSMLGISVILLMWVTFCLWSDLGLGTNTDADFPWLDSKYKEDKKKVDLWDQVDIKNDNSIITRLLDVFNIDIVKNDEHKFLNYVKAILNVALGLLSMIALIMTIYTFYMMFFSENEAWAKKAKWNLIGIFIALAIIWLAWLIVSLIFWWYQRYRQYQNDIIKQADITSMVDYKLDDQIYLTV